MFGLSRLTVSLTSAVKYVIRVKEAKLVDAKKINNNNIFLSKVADVFGAENSVSYFC